MFQCAKADCVFCVFGLSCLREDVRTCKLEGRERSIWEPSARESSGSHELEDTTLVNINEEFKGLTGAEGGSRWVQRFPFRRGGGCSEAGRGRRPGERGPGEGGLLWKPGEGAIGRQC